MTEISDLVTKLLPALVADPRAGSAAARAVMELGPRAIHALLRLVETAPSDTQARARFVADGLLLAFHSNRLLRHQPQVLLSAQVSPRQALIDIGDQLGIDIDAAAAPLADTPTLAPGSFSLAEVLDKVSAAIPDWTWRQDENGGIFLHTATEPRPSLPGVYAGPCHIQAKSFAVTQRWDARGASASSELRLGLTLERPFHKLFVPTLTLFRIEEENGHLHSLSAAQARLRNVDEVLHARFPSPPARAKVLRAVYGRVSGYFPVGYDEGELTCVQPGARIQTPNGPIEVEQLTAQGCTLRFTPGAAGQPTPTADIIDGVGLSLLLLGMDDQSRAATGRIQPFSFYPAEGDSTKPTSVVWNVSFHEPGREDFGPVTRLRYRTLTRLIGLGFPFCLSGVPIPKGPARRRKSVGIS